MDFYLTKVFRSICDDVQMLIDVYQITPQCQPVGRPFLECFTEGLAVVVEKESAEIVPALQYSDSLASPRIENTNNKTSNNALLWEFVHSIIIQFCAEELSQYPFWAAKVALATTDINAWHLEQSVFSAFWKLLSHKFESGGLFALYHGCIPYVLAAYFYNIAHVELLFRKFFVIVVSSIPRSPSAVARFQELRSQREQPPPKNSMLMPHRADYYNSAPILTADPAAHPQLISMRHMSSLSGGMNSSVLPLEVDSPSSGGTKNNIKGNNAGVGANTNPHGIYFNSLGIFGRVFRMSLAHPLLLLSVKMVTLPELQTSNWFLSYLHTLAKHGIGGLYSGWRASFLLAALPLNHIWLGGVAETIVYRCVLEQGTMPYDVDQMGIFSLLTSVVAAHRVLEQEGFSGMIRYGLLTGVQLVPGFLAFVTTRMLFKVAFGSTIQRRRQYTRRKEILQDYWLSMGGGSFRRTSTNISNISCSGDSVDFHQNNLGHHRNHNHNYNNYNKNNTIVTNNHISSNHHHGSNGKIAKFSTDHLASGMPDRNVPSNTTGMTNWDTSNHSACESVISSAPPARSSASSTSFPSSSSSSPSSPKSIIKKTYKDNNSNASLASSTTPTPITVPAVEIVDRRSIVGVPVMTNGGK